MKTVLYVSVVLCFGAVLGQQKQYTNKYDNIDIDSILKSERLLQNYVNCLLDRGKCTTDGHELKRILPDALQTGCSKCNEKQKIGSKKIVNFLIDNKPAVWMLLENKYDPQGSYKRQYKEQAKNEGFHI